MADENSSDKDEALFLSIMYSFHAAAMQQLGKIANPFTGKVERNLDAARGTIDVLAMFRKKTEGNLTDRERRVLTNLITELQLNYIDEAKREPAPEKEEAPREAEAEARAESEREAEPGAGEAEAKSAPAVGKTQTAPEEPARAREAEAAEAEKAGGERPEKKKTKRRRPAKKEKED
jgi:colicin import membrane protein